MLFSRKDTKMEQIKNIGRTLFIRNITGNSDLCFLSENSGNSTSALDGIASLLTNVKAVDRGHRRYDIEIWIQKDGITPNCIKEKLSAMSKQLDTAISAEEKPISYIIFIAKEDIYKADVPVYVIGSEDKDTGEMNDNSDMIFIVNLTYTGDEDTLIDQTIKAFRDGLCEQPVTRRDRRVSYFDMGAYSKVREAVEKYLLC